MDRESSPGQLGAGLVAALVAAWNAHDMAAFARLFHEDAAFVNVAGRYAHGRAEIEQLHAAAHAAFYRDSAITMRLEDARAVAADLVVAHATSVVRGDERAPGQVRETIMTLVIERRHGDWKISAAQNTVIVKPG
jgi:uncharacterized protein (TIGR02246 family)